MFISISLVFTQMDVWRHRVWMVDCVYRLEWQHIRVSVTLGTAAADVRKPIRLLPGVTSLMDSVCSLASRYPLTELRLKCKEWSPAINIMRFVFNWWKKSSTIFSYIIEWPRFLILSQIFKRFSVHLNWWEAYIWYINYGTLCKVTFYLTNLWVN